MVDVYKRIIRGNSITREAVQATIWWCFQPDIAEDGEEFVRINHDDKELFDSMSEEIKTATEGYDIDEDELELSASYMYYKIMNSKHPLKQYVDPDIVIDRLIYESQIEEQYLDGKFLGCEVAKSEQTEIVEQYYLRLFGLMYVKLACEDTYLFSPSTDWIKWSLGADDFKVAGWFTDIDDLVSRITNNYDKKQLMEDTRTEASLWLLSGKTDL